ncbi:MAG: hypothetical protein WKF91_23575, partial [Segetibacter sp.]
YGTLKLYIPFRALLNENGRVSNPVLAEVVATNEKYPEIEKGDVIILGHNTINNKAFELFTKDGIRTLSVPVDRWILGKIGAKGEFLPLFGNTVAQRVPEKPLSSIIITPDAYKKTEENKMNIIAVAPGVSDIKPGQTAIVHRHSDYEAVYHVNGEEHRTVVVYERDIVAIA